mmetsp:Transcript_39495/g.74122  ORF Transcript_39495/g.74122 Transcript_39495/m.74122 type:complete len:83 (-) Transcript_39495:92-340(-)
MLERRQIEPDGAFVNPKLFSNSRQRAPSSDCAWVTKKQFTAVASRLQFEFAGVWMQQTKDIRAVHKQKLDFIASLRNPALQT